MVILTCLKQMHLYCLYCNSKLFLAAMGRMLVNNLDIWNASMLQCMRQALPLAIRLKNRNLL